MDRSGTLAIEPDSNRQQVKLHQHIDTGDGYTELMDEYSLHRFIIRKGVTLEETPEFISYKRIFISRWGAIAYLIHLMEKML